MPSLPLGLSSPLPISHRHPPRFPLPRAVFRAFLSLLLALLMCGSQSTAAASNTTPASSRLKRIQSEREVRVCIWPDYYGITYRDPKNQQLSGIDYELALALGQDLNARVRFIDSSFASLFDDVLGERCDIAMFAIGITPSRAEKLRFTRPHLASDVYAITTRSNRRIRGWEDIDQPGVIAAVAKGTLHETVMRDKLKKATLQLTLTPHEREQEVEAGRADLFFTDYPYSRRMLEKTDWARLLSPPTTYHITPYAWVVKPGDDPWYARVERFMSDIKRDGRLLAAARRNGLETIVRPD